MKVNNMPQPLYTGAWGDCHIQGICADLEKGFIYYSFTTKLIKATLDGRIVGSVDGLVGHLGCIAFNKADGCVYGSLEYKNDAIGRGILSALNRDASFADSFYAVRFDVDRIDRLGIQADGNDIMTGVYLGEVVADYNGCGVNSRGEAVPHRHGCSGIDGTTFGPLPGKTPEDGMYLYVAYGVYSDIQRQDNDYQVLLCYDISGWEDAAKPLTQTAMHRSGFERLLHKYFVYTGNTVYGVQNLEYDAHTNAFYMAVYRGRKNEFPNYALFAVDASVPAERQMLKGLDIEGEVLTLCRGGCRDEKTGISGWEFPHGSTGLFSVGDGRWLISEPRRNTAGQCGYIFLYQWDGKTPFVSEAPED